MIERAVNTQYRIMIEKTIQGIKEGLSNAKNNVRSAGAVDVVVAGGTSSIAGFDILFKEAMKNVNLSIEIADVVRAENPTYTIAKGCLIAAENSN
jgi:actin-related protein